VIEGVVEVGRHFILYEVQEVGLIPIGCVWTTQLIAPTNSHLSVLLHFLAIILMAFLPCFFQSSTVFGKLGKVLKEEDPSQNQFSDPDSVVENSIKGLFYNADTPSPCYLISSFSFLLVEIPFQFNVWSWIPN
jgi:hypothetical protein